MAETPQQGNKTGTQDFKALSVIGGGSLLLEVKGEFTVPNVNSKEELRELLSLRKCSLDLRNTEIRMSDKVRKEVCEALGVKENVGDDTLRSCILLNGCITKAPAGTNELVRCFLRRGTREQHFSLVRELARRRRAELEKDVRRRVVDGPRTKTAKNLADYHSDYHSVDAASLHAADNRNIENDGDTRTAARGMSAALGTAAHVEEVAGEGVKPGRTNKAAGGRSAQKGGSLLPQPHEELYTFRSATTASELGTSRRTEVDALR
ncbi:hypothetical protein, conserved [Eimeria necatrix]|uniref:Uncharacterized protein n=1 Tax=Eimeria necatrix TaxID=51315 RepID=U6N1X1_9EIME|nr:hypothetical protein, conserved [Eimeria necatrix]CDJ70202.1 hypothetical protein, conserved [Eimeria necatrix]